MAIAPWAGLIVRSMEFGVATRFPGLVVAIPLVGHVTWPAYRYLVRGDSV